jgi:hypothetical protein
MEARLQPLDFRVGAGWSLQELEEKAREHMVSTLYILMNTLWPIALSFTERDCSLVSCLAL